MFKELITSDGFRISLILFALFLIFLFNIAKLIRGDQCLISEEVRAWINIFAGALISIELIIYFIFIR